MRVLRAPSCPGGTTKRTQEQACSYRQPGAWFAPKSGPRAPESPDSRAGSRLRPREGQSSSSRTVSGAAAEEQEESLIGDPCSPFPLSGSLTEDAGSCRHDAGHGGGKGVPSRRPLP
ncbi:hypothetical protein NDU88_002348 [Pleurodeles waltl]|uniref:Uncharacterized protein n=1 Tax=Pleurodeles waltl TaxID=8319 RepID=A0AAV7P8S9_PLEWA|nr:hypothetical protein NDU88_002348 [Pleurodeles waltl]